MRKNIDIDEGVLTKLKILAAFEDMSVKSIMEKAVTFFVEHKERERLNSLSREEKEDLGLLLLMQQSDREDVVDREEVMKALDE
jgi:predicted transcriptional regulator